MNGAASKPVVLYRYDQKLDYQRFYSQFADEMEIHSASTDKEALQYLASAENKVTAIILDCQKIDDALNSTLIEYVNSQQLDCLKVLLHQRISLDTIEKVLAARQITKCFHKPYDVDRVKSLIYEAKLVGVKGAASKIRRAEFTREHKASVLLVDDERFATKYLKKQLERKDVHLSIKTACDGYGALALLEKDQSIAVVITDQRMPGMLGNQLLNEIKHRYPQVVRILTSAYGEVDVALGAVNDGQIYQYIQKPWDADQVLSTIHQALEEYESSLSKDVASGINSKDVFNGIAGLRRQKIENNLNARIFEIIECNVLEDFFSALNQVQGADPEPVHIKASQTTELEKELIERFSDRVQLILSTLKDFTRLSESSGYWLSRQIVSELFPSIPAFPEMADQKNNDTYSKMVMIVVNAMDTLLATSNLERSDLSLKVVGQQWFVSISKQRAIHMYTHLLSPMTGVSRPLIEQQVAFFALMIICRMLGGGIQYQGLNKGLCFILDLPRLENDN